MIINHNIPALLTHLNLKKNDRLMTASMQRLSTGLKITSAKDDAAGLAIANKLSYQVGGLNQASENATNGISLIQTAEGALNEVHSMLQRMRELSVQGANDTLMSDDRAKIQAEIDGLVEEVNATANRTEFNKIKLLSGEASRVAGSYLKDASGIYATDKAVATVLYVSDKVPTGTLKYTIDTPGLPAQTVGANKVSGAHGEGVFSINGYEIEVSASDSYDEVMSQIQKACGYLNIDIQKDANDVLLLTTNSAGSDQVIDITGDDTFLQYFGLKSESSQGTDAKLTGYHLEDESGNPIGNFNSGITCVANGNQITITGGSGQVINFNIQLLHTDQAGVFEYGAQKPAQLADGSFQTLDMSLDIKDYGPIMLQVGPNYNMAMSVHIPKMNAETLGLVEYKNGEMYSLLNLQTKKSASKAITMVDDSILMVSNIRGRLGAYQNRLESTVRSLDTAAENTEASRSRIQDTDMAKEMTLYTQQNVMYQAGLAILGQANQRPQQILSLLQ